MSHNRRVIVVATLGFPPSHPKPKPSTVRCSWLHGDALPIVELPTKIHGQFHFAKLGVPE